MAGEPLSLRHRWILPALAGVSVLALAVGIPLVAEESEPSSTRSAAARPITLVDFLPDLTGHPLLWGLVAVAVGVPLVLALTWRFGRRRLLGGLVRLVAVLLAQLAAVGAVAVGVNDHYVFYNTWADILGGGPEAANIRVSQNALVPQDGTMGKVVRMVVTGRVSGERHAVLVWLPPQYGQKAYAHVRFPVLMMLTTQPGSPSSVFAEFNFAHNAVAAINAHKVKPFVAVMPPIQIDPPRDTECTDVPHGPQAESWLTTDVREAVVKHFRVSPEGTNWSTAGLSTGGFCAAKLLLRHRTLFNAAASVGGYFDAETDRTTGDLFGHSVQLRNENSPLWLIEHSHGLPANLLIIVSRRDRYSWAGAFYANSAKMVAATAGYPGVATIILPSGGHSVTTYLPTFPATLGWLGRTANL